MKIDLTRRGFAMLSAALVLMSGASLTFAADHASPYLQEVEDLIPAASPGKDGLALYEHRNMVLVDVRPAEEYLSGHIFGARLLDPNAVTAPAAPIEGALRPEAEIAALLGELGLDRDTRIVFYDDRGGLHAARMFWLLEYLGHRNVAVLNGGLTAWRDAGGSVTQEVSPVVPKADFGVAPMPRRLATADYLLSHAADPESVVVDVRPPKLFAEGRIPWAINLPWSANLGSDKKLLPLDRLAAHFKDNGVTPDRNVVVHCQQGLAAAHSYLALRVLGYPRVRVYHRSWSEWGSDPSLPSATGT